MGAAVVMKNWVFKEEGLPAKVVSNRGPQFVSSFMRELYKLLGIEGNPSTAYHPQTDGQTERVNREVEKYLRMFTNHQQDDWVDWLPIAEFAFNNTVHEATGQTPFSSIKDDTLERYPQT
jgi:transposase InsO family protein